MNSRLWVPPSMRDEHRTAFCRICGDRLLPGEAVSHIAKCYARNEGEVRMMSLREKAPAIMGDDGVDVEFLKWHKDRGYRHAT